MEFRNIMSFNLSGREFGVILDWEQRPATIVEPFTDLKIRSNDPTGLRGAAGALGGPLLCIHSESVCGVGV
jgi:hypothetical protein